MHTWYASKQVFHWGLKKKEKWHIYLHCVLFRGRVIPWLCRNTKWRIALERSAAVRCFCWEAPSPGHYICDHAFSSPHQIRNSEQEYQLNTQYLSNLKKKTCITCYWDVFLLPQHRYADMDFTLTSGCSWQEVVIVKVEWELLNVVKQP